MTRKILCLVWVVVLTTGFRTYSPTTLWDMTSATPKIFVRFCETPAVTTNDLPAGDPLYGQVLTFASVVASVYLDFTSIPGAYLQIVDTTDPEYVVTSTRVIDVCFKSQTGGGGVARQQMGSGGKLSGCTIELDPSLATSAKKFVKTLTHEIGHCVGLDHSQDNVQSLMSYFSESDLVRLQMDDKMGIIQQFPLDPAYAQETATFGASCAPRD
jgi:hypothetical protein